MKSTKWACAANLNHLGIGNDFNMLITNAGPQDFVYSDAPTYRCLTLELLATSKHTVRPCSGGEGYDCISFQLMNRRFDISLNEWCDLFGFYNNDSYLRSSHIGLRPSPRSYCRQMSIPNPNYKGKHIESPAIPYLYYVVANIL
jgi:hypothetical protein